MVLKEGRAIEESQIYLVFFLVAFGLALCHPTQAHIAPSVHCFLWATLCGAMPSSSTEREQKLSLGRTAGEDRRVQNTL